MAERGRVAARRNGERGFFYFYFFFRRKQSPNEGDEDAAAGSNRDGRRLNLDRQRPATEQKRGIIEGGFGEQRMRALFVTLF